MKKFLLTAAMALLAVPAFAAADQQPNGGQGDSSQHGGQGQHAGPQGGQGQPGGGQHGGDRGGESGRGNRAPGQSSNQSHAGPAGSQNAGGKGQADWRNQPQIPDTKGRMPGNPDRDNGRDNNNRDRGNDHRADNNNHNNDRNNNFRPGDRGNGFDRNHGNQFGNRDHRDWGNVRNFHRNFNATRRFHAPIYRRPPGYSYRRWTWGQTLPSIFWSQDYWLNDYDTYDLPPPPPGAVWVRYGNDALLIDQDSGEIIETEYDVFY